MYNNNRLLFEVSAEVCYQLGGIHTVIASKIAYMRKYLSGSYFLVGPYISGHPYNGVFAPLQSGDAAHTAVQRALENLQRQGVKGYVGYWNVEGRPLVILFDPVVIPPGFDQYRTRCLTRIGIPEPPEFSLVEMMLSFGYCLELFFTELCRLVDSDELPILVHFHEYMTAAALPAIARLPVRTVFTTHATVPGRMLAAKNRSFHARLPETDWTKQIHGMSAFHRFALALEKLAARECHVFTAVSELTARECQAFHGRTPDVLVPNGLNTDRIHKIIAAAGNRPKAQLDSIVRKHFQGHMPMDPDKTFYFFTSGRYEYVNKGYDLILGALNRLSRWITQKKTGITIVMFFITDTPHRYGSVWRNTMRRLRGRLPANRHRRADYFPHTVPDTYRHCQLVSEARRYGLTNAAGMPVKIVYHPQFLSAESPSLPMDYISFVSACDLGIFPSRYEPWGYTPMECATAMIPAITTNQSGFGNFIACRNSTLRDAGIFVIDGQRQNDINELYQVLRRFITEPANYRDSLRAGSELFDWNNMIANYMTAYRKAVV